MIGTYNTGIGYGVLRANTTGYWNTATGSYSLSTNTTGDYNSAYGYYALYANTEGSYNTAIGFRSLQSNTTGSNNTFIGAYTGPSANNLTNATAIGYGAVVTSSNRVKIGNADVDYIGGAVDFTVFSDRRKKEDIKDITHGLDFIKALRPVEYRLIKKKDKDRLNFGFIAQDIEALLGTNYNVLGIENDPERSLSLRYTDFIAPLVKAVQEQQGIIEQQKKSIAEMRSELDNLKTEIMAMKAGK